ncbi:Uncharacterised protein [Escherichia coli]|nr:Uncharacterised protein [Escherichia coli]
MAKLKSNLKASASQVYAVLTDRGRNLKPLRWHRVYPWC